MRSIPPVGDDMATPGSRRTKVLSQNLLALGFTSFFTDISSEMVVAILPLFLINGLGVGFFGVAVYEALNQAVNAAARIWGGAVADKRQRHKQTAATGYTISATTRLGLVASTFAVGPPLAVPFLLAERIGKGLRTAPRDALISLSTAPERLALAFGIHRAMDTAGALLGPLVAFAIWSQAEGAFDAVFVISAIVGAIGAAVIWLFAEEKPQAQPPTERPRVMAQWREVRATKGVGAIAIAVALLSVVTVGDAFVYLMIQRTGDFSAKYFPLLFVGTALVYLLLAMPLGRLADRVGTRPVFLSGNALLIAMYLVLAFSGLGFGAAVLCLGLLGAYYAATDGVVPAMVSQLVPPHVRASGIAFITVIIAGARMLSALVFAGLFETVGQRTTLLLLATAMAAAILLSLQLLRPADDCDSAGDEQLSEPTPH